ncbi:hypothetical protein RJ639_046507 [Escallonia herrerae]|uniref:Pentatricopeptide repeat-containing protein n=1 Tax=Escallonia herrerae TaxID=1293975 RepID=A0AA88W932_9ASTE|nr:hypothetical protein RJ639_046507 [Escallonia herrerae]
MIKLGHHPSHCTYGSLLKGLCKGGNFREAMQFLNELHSIPSALDAVVYNTLLAETCKSGNLRVAVLLLDEMIRNNVLPDSHSYTSLLAGLCKRGKMVAAILLFERGIERGTFVPNQLMYTSLIDGLFKAGQPKAAAYFYEEMVKKGFYPDTVALNAIMDGYSRMGQMAKVENIFSLMRGGMLEIAVKILKMIIAEGTMADKCTFNMLISKCSERREMGKAFDLLNTMSVLGVFPDGDTYDAIFRGLNITFGFRDSQNLLHEMLEKGILPTERQYITLITGMCRVGDIQGAFKLKDEMEALGVSSRNVAESAMVRGLVKLGKTEEAMLVLDCMLRVQLIPTIATFTTLMHICCKQHKLVEALKLKGIMELHGVKLDVVAYNVIIAGLCANGDISHAFELYEEMKRRDLCPNTTTFTVLIDAISKKRDYEKGTILLADMRSRGLIAGDESMQDLSEGLMFWVVKKKQRRSQWNTDTARVGEESNS